MFAVDLDNNRLKWTYGYRDDELKKPEEKVPAPVSPGPRSWAVAGLLVLDDRLIFAGPDDAAIHCVDIKDGTKLWKTSAREGELHLAGLFNDVLLVVGPSQCRAVGVADGKDRWLLETGVPSGRGAAADGLYFLPLRKGAASKEPEICVLDVAKGKIRANLPAPKGEVLGNLALHDRMLISQTATHLTVFPRPVVADAPD